MYNFVFDKIRFDALMIDIDNSVKSFSNNDLRQSYLDIFHCIDHTTLHDEDNTKSVTVFCRAAASCLSSNNIGTMASICVYPEYVAVVKKEMAPYDVKVAAVTGGFPTGQMPLSLKLQEVRYAIDNGADEVDFVINRGFFLDGDHDRMAEEISSVRRQCGTATTLKVILETGQLKTPELIYNASMIAMENGAEFIKTSTGKSGTGVTPEAAYAMLNAIRDFYKKSNRIIGFKASGGISTTVDALLYYCMTKKILDIIKINNQIFRIGTSRLVGELIKKLTV